LGLWVVAGVAATIAKVLFFIFLVFFVMALFGKTRRGPRR